MGNARRYLVWSDLRHANDEGFLSMQEERYAACPEAAAFTNEDAEDFLLAALALDGLAAKDLLRVLRRAGVIPPVELFYDCYRMGRYLFRRWLDPDVKQRFLINAMHVPAGGIARIRRFRNPHEMHRTVDRHGPAAAVAVYRAAQATDLIEDLRKTFTPQEERLYQATVLYAKVQLHRFVTEPEPARLPSGWEQQKLLRRIHLRDVQLRSMRRSRRQLRGERSVLLSRLREISLQEQPELRDLAAELEAVRAARQQAEREHQGAMAEQVRRYEEAIAMLRAELAAAQSSYGSALALRRNLLGRKGE